MSVRIKKSILVRGIPHIQFWWFCLGHPKICLRNSSHCLSYTWLALRACFLKNSQTEWVTVPITFYPKYFFKNHTISGKKNPVNLQPYFLDNNAVKKFHEYLFVEFLINHFGGFLLDTPRFGRRTQITAGHRDSLN